MACTQTDQFRVSLCQPDRHEMNVNKQFVQLLNKICDLQAELGVEFRLRGFIKAELFNEEQAEAMARAGFRWVLCGFEGANPRILENIDKIATVDDNTRAVLAAKKYGLKVKEIGRAHV